MCFSHKFQECQRPISCCQTCSSSWRKTPVTFELPVLLQYTVTEMCLKFDLNATVVRFMSTYNYLNLLFQTVVFTIIRYSMLELKIKHSFKLRYSFYFIQPCKPMCPSKRITITVLSFPHIGVLKFLFVSFFRVTRFFESKKPCPKWLVNFERPTLRLKIS